MKRNAASKILAKQMKKIRNFVKARFDKKPEIAVLFEPISRGRGAGGNGEDEKPGENPTPPAAPTTPTA
jgi:hypothetical protein